MPVTDRARSMRVLPVIGLLTLTCLALTVLLVLPTYPDYDSTWALLWARELIAGTPPSFGSPGAPTEHPLWVAVAAVVAPLGDGGARLLVMLCVASLLALVAAVYRLGRLAAGRTCGLLAAAITLKLSWMAALGFLDIPYAALVAWAAVLETERPRRGWPVCALLLLAGLLRPDAWVIAGLYGMWLSWRSSWKTRTWAIAFAALAPALWCLFEVVVTGDPLFTLHQSSTSTGILANTSDAAALGHDAAQSNFPEPGAIAASGDDAAHSTSHGPEAVALALSALRHTASALTLFGRHLVTLLAAPVVSAAVVGLGLSLALRRSAVAVLAAVSVAASAMFVPFAFTQAGEIPRYVIVPALAAAVFAAFALTGWRILPHSTLWRARWATMTCIALVVGALYSTYKARQATPLRPLAELQERSRIHADLHALLMSPGIAAARRCGPITVPNQKLIPFVRWILRIPDGMVLSRSHNARPEPRGVAISVTPRVAFHPILQVGTGDLDRRPLPSGFHQIAANGSFSAWGAC